MKAENISNADELRLPFKFIIISSEGAVLIVVCFDVSNVTCGGDDSAETAFEFDLNDDRWLGISSCFCNIAIKEVINIINYVLWFIDHV